MSDGTMREVVGLYFETRVEFARHAGSAACSSEVADTGDQLVRATSSSRSVAAVLNAMPSAR